MRVTRDNLFMDGLRGSTRNMTVSKRESGEFIVSGRRGRNTKGLSELQKRNKEFFMQAINYGRSVVKNPEKREIYHAFKRPNFNAYTLAVQDALRVPEVKSINTLEYTGDVNQPITVRATDDFKVVRVRVWIRNAAGEILESGEAMLQGNENDWLYTTTATVGQLTGSKITAVAFDLPNNQGSLEIVL